MCDYSLEHHQHRSAREGESLTTTSLGEHATIGMTSIDQPDVAVCLLPGTRVRVTGKVPPALASDMSISPGDMATFRQLDLIEGRVGYRDGLTFDCHKDPTQVIPFQELLAGLCVEVVEIPAERSTASTDPLIVAEDARARELEPA